MKQAKRRPHSLLAQFMSSTRRTSRAVSSAIAYVAKSNQRLEKHKTGRLAQLIAEMPEGLPRDSAWENMVPVGLEIIDYGEPPAAAASEMHEFMASAPAAPNIDQDALKRLIDDGRA